MKSHKLFNEDLDPNWFPQIVAASQKLKQTRIIKLAVPLLMMCFHWTHDSQTDSPSPENRLCGKLKLSKSKNGGCCHHTKSTGTETEGGGQEIVTPVLMLIQRNKDSRQRGTMACRPGFTAFAMLH